MTIPIISWSLRTLPLAAIISSMKTLLGATMTMLALIRTSDAQTIPVIDLPAATAMSSQRFSIVSGLRVAPDGSVLVNDAFGLQLTRLDSTLTHATIVLGSTEGATESYGTLPSRLVPYLGDSSLFPDAASGTLHVRDPNGKMIRAIAAPVGVSFAFLHGTLATRPSGTDNRGRLIFAGGLPPTGDSSAILRADFDARTIDTIGRVRLRDGGTQTVDSTVPGKIKYTLVINPLPSLDGWAVLSDGSVAIVRAQDYHIDWILPDGSRRSSPKLPFDWRRLTDEEKRGIIDSAKAANGARNPTPPPGRGGSGSGGGRSGQSGVAVAKGADRSGDPSAVAPRTPQIDVQYYEPSQIGDYIPPLRYNGVLPDADGNLWIVPSTSTLSKHGELVYDVINPTVGLFERVRIPEGRSIAGFGRGGVIFLVAGDRKSGYTLERTRLPGGPARPR
jgi:hypothetical protein